MSKPWKHAVSSANKWGGNPEDYIEIHDTMDSTKSCVADVRHRAIFHSAFGVFIVEKIFGHNIVNSDGRLVSVRDIAEKHIIEDLGTIPTMQDWFKELPIRPWMSRPNKEVETMELFETTEDNELKNRQDPDLHENKLCPNRPILIPIPLTESDFPFPYQVKD